MWSSRIDARSRLSAWSFLKGISAQSSSFYNHAGGGCRVATLKSIQTPSQNRCRHDLQFLHSHRFCCEHARHRIAGGLRHLIGHS